MQGIVSRLIPMDIFKDREKLSSRYIPERLPHREREVEDLAYLFKEDRARGLSVQLGGPAGSGKTSCAIHAGRRLSTRGTVPVYVNLKILRNKFAAYTRMLEQLTGSRVSRSRSKEELIGLFAKASRNKSTMIIVDEIDFYVRTTGDTSMVYDLTRMNEIEPYNRVAGTIFIYRDDRWKKLLDEAELSTLGAIVLKLSKYSLDQIIDILQYRCDEAFRANTVSDEVIEYVADFVESRLNSDIRFALDIMYYAGTLAERRNKHTVGVEEVREVLSYLIPTITSEDLQLLEDTDKLVLLSLSYRLLEKKAPYATFTGAYAKYADISSKVGRRYNVRTFEKSLQRLYDLGIVDFKGPRKLGLNVPLNKITKIVEDMLRNRGYDI